MQRSEVKKILGKFKKALFVSFFALEKRKKKIIARAGTPKFSKI
jgi:hypothetical protein